MVLSKTIVEKIIYTDIQSLLDKKNPIRNSFHSKKTVMNAIIKHLVVGTHLQCLHYQLRKRCQSCDSNCNGFS